jgi:hypothetical protein
MRKEAQVHMLPTEDISQVHYNKVRYPNEIKYELSFHKEPSKCKNDGLCSGNQHLYITTDDKIKEGDWYIIQGASPEGVYNTLPNGGVKKEFAKKIIATTDPKLTTKEVIKVGDRVHSNKQDFNDQIVATESSAKLYNKSDHYFKSLVRIPQSFIEEYCKAGGIDEVDVEYDVITNTYDNIADLMCPHSVAEYEQTTSSISKLKVDPIYNTITTHLVEPEYYAVYDEVTNKTLHIQAPTLKDAEIIAAAIDFDNFVDGQNILTNPTVTLVEEKMYTLKDIKRAFYAGHQWATGDGKPIHSFKEWVEENL